MELRYFLLMGSKGFPAFSVSQSCVVQCHIDALPSGKNSTFANTISNAPAREGNS
jgi:hypothetical protein